MRWTWTSLVAVASLASHASAQMFIDPFQKLNISAEGINVTMIAYGSRVTNVYVADVNGTMQDIVLGYDDATQYLNDTETNHTYYGAVVGRYANRIKNGTFTINGQTSQIPENEHMGHDTLHGGNIGYDQRNWTLVAMNQSSVTFMLVDSSFEGFPGTVLTYSTYSVSNRRLTITLTSQALDSVTPIMLAQHVYWNLGAFVDGPNSTVKNQVLAIPYGKRLIGTDSIQVPDGTLEAVAGTPFDFTTAKTIGQDLMQANQSGAGSVGYDNAWILDRPHSIDPRDSTDVMVQLTSPSTGIRMNIRTNQNSIQMYDCLGQNNTIPVKQSQQHGGNQTSYVQKFGCTVFETQQWIDGINYPEWGQLPYQVFSPQTGPAINWAQYDFSTVADVSKAWNASNTLDNFTA